MCFASWKEWVIGNPSKSDGANDGRLWEEVWWFLLMSEQWLAIPSFFHDTQGPPEY